MCEVLDRIEDRGIQKGIQKGIVQGEDTILSLIRYLLSNNREEEIKMVAEDESYRNKLLKELFQNK